MVQIVAGLPDRNVLGTVENSPSDIVAPVPLPNNPLSRIGPIAEDAEGDADWTSCPVCGNPAGKHSFYGARTCNSCRAFFRRSIQGGRQGDFRCKFGQKCVIDSKSWKSCQKCRFERCLEAGMKASYVLSDREREKRNEKRQKCRAVRLFRQCNESPLSVRTPKDLFTPDEFTFLSELWNYSVEFVTKGLCKFSMESPEIMELFRLRPAFPVASLKKFEVAYEKVIKAFYAEMSDMLELDPEDQSALVDSNVAVLFSFGTSTNLENSVDWERREAESRRIMRENLDKEEFQLMQREMAKLKLSKVDNCQKSINIEELFSSSWADPATEKKHRNILRKVGAWGQDPATKSNDDLLLCLIILILVFSHDGIRPKDAKKIEAFRTKYTHMLYKYVNYKYKPSVARTKFIEAMYVRPLILEANRMKKTDFFREKT